MKLERFEPGEGGRGAMPGESLRRRRWWWWWPPAACGLPCGQSCGQLDGCQEPQKRLAWGRARAAGRCPDRAEPDDAC